MCTDADLNAGAKPGVRNLGIMRAHVLPLGTRVVGQYLGVRHHVPAAVWGPFMLTDCVRVWVAPSLGSGPTVRPLSTRCEPGQHAGGMARHRGGHARVPGGGPGPASKARSRNVPCAACRFCRSCSQQATKAL